MGKSLVRSGVDYCRKADLPSNERGGQSLVLGN